MGVTAKSIDHDVHVPEEMSICTKCGTVQLSKLINLKLLYEEPHQPGIVGETWSKHHKQFSEYVLTHCGKKIVEIGAGSLTLAKLILSKKNVHYTVVDPQAISEPNIHVVPEFFSTFTEIGSPDTIVHSHTLEHFYEPCHILRTINRRLPIGGRMIVSVPDIQSAISAEHHNALNFEHTYMTSQENLKYMFRSAGFSIADVTRFNTTNLFYVLVKENTGAFFSKTTNPTQEYEHNRSIYNSYLESSNLDMSVASERANRLNADVFLFGSHVFSQRLLEFGANKIKNLAGVIDNNPNKQNLRLYGTSLITYGPEILADRPATVLVRSAQYTNEIVNQLQTQYPHVSVL